VTRNIERAIRGEGADGAILGCTEPGLLIGQRDLTVAVFDTAAIHVRAALNFVFA
jgi:aspartate racemase